MIKYSCIFPLFVFLLFSSLQSQTSQSASPGLAETIPSPGCLACPGDIWMNEMNVQFLDGNDASVNMAQAGFCFQSTCYLSRFLRGTDFGFNIPLQASITGIRLELDGYSSTDSTAQDSIVTLLKYGFASGSNYGLAKNWPLAITQRFYGGPGDLWGGAPGTWTPQEINDSLFGVDIKMKNTGANAVAMNLDYVKITVYYSTCSISLTTNQTDNSCFGDSMGTATIHPGSSGAPFLFSWLPYGGNDSIATGLAAGIYKVAVTDSTGCTDTATATILEPPLISDTLNQSMCDGDTVFFGGQFLIAAGTFDDTLISAGGCDSLEVMVLSVIPLPAVNLAILGVDTVCDDDSMFVLTGGSPPGGGYSGQAVVFGQFDPGSATIGASMVYYTYTDTTGCSNSDSDAVIVEVCTGLGEQHLKDLMVFPNPNDGEFVLEISGGISGEAAISIWNVLGQMAAEIDIAGTGRVAIQLGTHPSGIYTAIVRTGQGLQKAKVVVH